SRSSYGAMSFGASARSGGYVNESIPIPLVKQRNCRRRQRPAFARGQYALVCQSPQHGGACAAEGDRLAVYVERSVIVKKLRRAVESQAACGGGGRKSRLAHRRRRRKANVRLRLGQKTSEEARDVARVPAHPLQRGGDIALHLRVDTRGRAGRRHARIAVLPFRQPRVIAQEVEESLRDLRVHRRSKSDRVRDACVDGGAFVRDARR